MIPTYDEGDGSGPSEGVLQRKVTKASPSGPLPVRITSYLPSYPAGRSMNTPGSISSSFAGKYRAHGWPAGWNEALNVHPSSGNSTVTWSGLPTLGGFAGGIPSAQRLMKQYVQARRSTCSSP
jgi:hypothetical protein